MNIFAYIFIILKRLVKILIFILKGIIFIKKLKNKYYILIIINLYPLLITDTYMLKVIIIGQIYPIPGV